MNKNQIDDFLKLLNSAQRAAILPHVMPDGDALGSSYALSELLEAMGISTAVFVEDEAWLPKNAPTFNYIYYDDTLNYSGFDTCIAVDCGDLQRLSKRSKLFHDALFTANIDHHPTNTMFAMCNLVEPQRAATGEIIYEIYQRLNVQISPSAAYYLYLSISTDTGCFRYSNTTANTLRTAAQLVELGAPSCEINNEVFGQKKLSQLKIIALILNSLKLYNKGRTCIMCVTQEMMRQVGATESDLEGAACWAREVEGVSVGAFLREREDGIKVSMRSKSDVDISGLCVSLGGGGHKNAAGFMLKCDMKSAVKIVSDKCTSLYRKK